MRQLILIFSCQERKKEQAKSFFGRKCSFYQRNFYKRALLLRFDDVIFTRRNQGSTMATEKAKQEAADEDYSLLPLVHDIIKWYDHIMFT